MAHIELTVTIDRPVPDVYRVLSTPGSTSRWSRSAIEEHMTTPGPLAIGSRRRATVRGLGGRTAENEIEVTALEPERRLAVRSVTAPVPFTTAWTFTPVGGGTRVDWVWDLAMPGWLRPFDGLVGALFARSFEQDLMRLKAMLESGEI